VLLRNGDVLEGVLNGLEANEVAVEVDKKPVAVKVNQVAAVALSSDLADALRPKGVYARLVLTEAGGSPGGRLSLSSATCTDGATLKGVTVFGAAVGVPLAIHGGTGFPPDSVAAAISSGVAKFNVGTRLKRGFLDAVLERTRSWSGNESVHDLVGSHKQADFLAAGQSAITETVRSLLRIYGSSSRA